MTDPGPAPSCDANHCITCGDDGVPMSVLRLDAAAGLAACAGDDGDITVVDTTLVDPVAVGDRVLVHAGVAIAALDPAGVIV